MVFPCLACFWLKRFARRMFGVYFFSGLYTLQETNISPKNAILKMIFLFPRWDMLIPWRVIYFCIFEHCSVSGQIEEGKVGPLSGIFSAWKKNLFHLARWLEDVIFPKLGGNLCAKNFCWLRFWGFEKKLVPLEKPLRRRTLLP